MIGDLGDCNVLKNMQQGKTEDTCLCVWENKGWGWRSSSGVATPASDLYRPGFIGNVDLVDFYK